MSNRSHAMLVRRAAALAVLLAALVVAAAPAEAQAVRYVSVAGSDASPCTLAAPCRTLATAIGGAPAGAEVRLLDSGNFGAAVTIAKSLTISGDGNTLILSGDNAITVDNAAVKVALRGLLLTGLGVNDNGIVGAAAASLHITGCEIERFNVNGIIALGGVTELFVSDTVSRNNGSHGVRVDGDGSTRVTVENSRFENNADRGATIDAAQSSVMRSTFSGNGDTGLNAGGGAAISVAWSTAASNGVRGFVVNNAEVQLESSVARGNGFGVDVFNGGVASISNMTVTDNGRGVFNSGTVRTRQNNRVFGNDIDFDGTAPVPLGGT